MTHEIYRGYDIKISQNPNGSYEWEVGKGGVRMSTSTADSRSNAERDAMNMIDALWKSARTA